MTAVLWAAKSSVFVHFHFLIAAMPGSRSGTPGFPSPRACLEPRGISLRLLTSPFTSLLQGPGPDLLWGSVWIFHLKRQKSR